MPKPDQSPAQRARESITAKVAAFDKDPAEYEGVAAMVDPEAPANPKEDPDGTDED